MPDEIPAPETTAPAPPVETPAPAPAPPPATRIIVSGEKTEREIELEGRLSDTSEKLTASERRALEAERKAAELERENQNLKEIPKPAKVKRAPRWSDPVFSSDED